MIYRCKCQNICEQITLHAILHSFSKCTRVRLVWKREREREKGEYTMKNLTCYERLTIWTVVNKALDQRAMGPGWITSERGHYTKYESFHIWHSYAQLISKQFVNKCNHTNIYCTLLSEPFNIQYFFHPSLQSMFFFEILYMMFDMCMLSYSIWFVSMSITLYFIRLPFCIDDMNVFIYHIASLRSDITPLELPHTATSSMAHSLILSPFCLSFLFLPFSLLHTILSTFSPSSDGSMHVRPHIQKHTFAA